MAAHGFLNEALIVSDGAGQFNVGEPAPGRRARELRARIDRIFVPTTDFATLDRLLQRLHANQAEHSRGFAPVPDFKPNLLKKLGVP